MSRKKKRLSMNKIREILRLAWQCKRSNREIAQSCAISHTAVNDYLETPKRETRETETCQPPKRETRETRNVPATETRNARNAKRASHRLLI
jgi:hypothetical protein